MPKALASGECRRDARIGTAIAVASSGDGPPEERSDDGIMCLFIAGVEPVLHHKGRIAEAVLGRAVVLNVRRYIQQQLNPTRGNQLQPFATAIVPRVRVPGSDLPHEVCA